ncbi:hypothetical protein RJ641_000026 [Dillenia turbinata]|uniref:Uncharacterized protein n=1 Tax=Dillenia turbinata TaxID=194707 RepID=A0AAN8UH56_9MAGN
MRSFLRVRHILMSARLSTNLQLKYNVRSMLIPKDGEFQVMRGTYKGCVGHPKWVIHVEHLFQFLSHSDERTSLHQPPI